MTVCSTDSKKKTTLEICKVALQQQAKATIRFVGKLFREFSNSFIAATSSPLHYRAAERVKTHALKQHKSNCGKLTMLK